MRGIAFLLGRLLKAVLTGWISGVKWIWRMVRALFARKQVDKAKSERERRMSDQRCEPIRHPALHRPDPLIYSQTYLMGLGLAVTWDNPDIELSLNGVPVPSSPLQADTEYDVTARIWNASTEAPVIGMPVRLTQHGFGIGAAATQVDDTTVDVGVKGGPGHPAFAHLKWRTPPVAGHFCLQVHLDWFDDSNPNNNVGQENTNVAVSQSPAQTTFTLRNEDRQRRRRYHFAVDTYTVPEPPPCRDVDREGDRKRRYQRLLAAQPLTERTLAPAVRERHAAAAHPLPPGWTVQLHPEEAVLAPGDDVDVQVLVTPAAGFTGRQAINVNAFDDVGPAGGVTLLVEAT
jgi:hypothetical protein